MFCLVGMEKVVVILFFLFGVLTVEV